MITAVIVTYQPGDVSHLLSEYTAQCDNVIVVDNGSKQTLRDNLRRQCQDVGADVLELGDNLGIAAAQNAGIKVALERGSDHVLLSDQDSVPASTMVAALARTLLSHPEIGAAGPLPTEDREGADELVYVDHGWGPTRASASELREPLVDVAFLVASGCLIRREAIEDVGLMREDLFIDHVDLEWGLRARQRGWRLVAVPEVQLTHSLGDAVIQLPGRSQPVHVHSPLRNYYLVRNTLELMTGDLMPVRWRARYAVWLMKFAAFNILVVPPRRARLAMVLAGARDFLSGRMGARRPTRQE